MDAAVGERFVAERAVEGFQGLRTTGMVVCATVGGPRMGALFGIMLMSGERVGALILEAE
jgi:ribulose 1,5-bisphosphate synthetase/thiazole synthase